MNAAAPRVGFIIPVYRHLQPLLGVLAQLKSYGLPCFLVDDHNEPPLADFLKVEGKLESWMHVTRLAHHGGKGAACLEGSRQASAQGFTHAIFLDADGQHETADVPRILTLLEKNPNAMILGRPVFDASAPFGRRMGRWISNIWVWIETGSRAIQDSLCGFRALPLTAVLNVDAKYHLGQKMDFDPDLVVRLYWEGLPVVNFDTPVRYPPGGVSNFRLWRDNLLLCALHTRLVFAMLWQRVKRA